MEILAQWLRRQFRPNRAGPLRFDDGELPTESIHRALALALGVDAQPPAARGVWRALPLGAVAPLTFDNLDRSRVTPPAWS